MRSDNQPEKDFLHDWFEGFSEAFALIGDQARHIILRECGEACARSYTAAVFKEEWERSGEIDRFLVNLARRFPEASYQRMAQDKIEVHYSRCACDLVAAGYIKTPLFCQCSAENLRANFESSLNRPVNVRIASSILGGADQCVLMVDLDGAKNRGVNIGR